MKDLLLSLFIQKTYAVCPVCTVAVGAGVGLSRWLGIDDTITGLWVGGLIVSLIIWTISYLEKKKIQFFAQRFLVVLGYYLLVLMPLYWTEILGHPYNKLWGVDKLFLGIALGSVVLALSAWGYFKLKEKNNGRPYFPFQKVIMPVGALLILSIIFYFLTR